METKACPNLRRAIFLVNAALPSAQPVRIGNRPCAGFGLQPGRFGVLFGSRHALIRVSRDWSPYVRHYPHLENCD